MAKKATGLAAFTRRGPARKPPALQRSRTTARPWKSRRRGERGRGETVALTVKVRRSDWQRLRQLADAEGTTIQAMAEAGLSAVLAQHGLPPIEPYAR
ncbi:hypothetical protein HED51_23625 [Ochrobactrum grignonense]|nr:hypothetical protein [Brucella grignonensis]